VKFSSSLKNNYEFRRLYSRGKSAASPQLVVYCRRTGKNENRVGISVSTKIGKAVHRNRVRRRLREIYRLNEDKLLRGVDMVIVARVRSRYVSYSGLEKAFLENCSKLGITADSRPESELQ